MSDVTNAERVKVLFIAGWGRSGSTVLDSLLGTAPSYCSVGELSSIWRLGVLGGHLCSCGSRVPECPFWADVLRSVVGRDDYDSFAVRATRLQEEVVRERRLLRLIRVRDVASSGWAALHEYLDIVERLYTAVSRIADRTVVVDSSKVPTDGALLPLLPSVEPYLIHLVRDPRAAAFSWKRTKLQPTAHGRVEMPRRSASNSTMRWVVRNLGTEILMRRFGSDRRSLVRYEDLLQQPARVLSTIRDMVHGSEEEVHDRDQDVHRHMVSGNPLRFDTKDLVLKPDLEWVEKQTTRDRLAATAVALPLLRRYRYPLVVAHPS